jgi:hypothetical protein
VKLWGRACDVCGYIFSTRDEVSTKGACGMFSSWRENQSDVSVRIHHSRRFGLEHESGFRFDAGVKRSSATVAK